MSALFIILLVGCVPRFDPEAMQLHRAELSPPVYGAHQIAQCFVPTRPSLVGIEIFASPPVDPSAPPVLRVREGPGSSRDLRSVPFTADSDGRLMARFPPLRGYEGRQLCLIVTAPEATADRSIALMAAKHDVYGAGAAYIDDAAWDGDLAFRSYYGYDSRLLWQDLGWALRHLWVLLPLLALFWAPGYLLLQLWPGRREYDVLERLGLGVGLSLAILPLALLWVTQLGGTVTAGIARGAYGVLGLGAVGLAGARYLRKAKAGWADRGRLGRVLRWFSPVILALGLGFAVRGLAARDLAFPAWLDSVQHATLARIILERGRVPRTYAPYVPAGPAPYHYGFHADVAAFAWLTGFEIPKAMLVVGQVFNGLMALQVYLIAKWLTERRRVAGFAAWIVALLSSMPAYYLSWGRYTQLAGLLILPVAAQLLLLGVVRRERRLQVLAVLSIAGLTVTHYRVLAFFVCLVAAYWVVQLVLERQAWRVRMREATAYVVLSTVALLLLMPWLWGTARSLWIPVAAHRTSGVSAALVALSDFSLTYVAHGIDRYLLALGVLGAVVALVDRKPFAVVLMLWMLGVFAVTNPSLFRLPGESLTNNVAMLIMWFIPLAIWVGYLCDALLRSWGGLLKGWLRWGAAAVGLSLAIALSVVGWVNQVTIMNPDCVIGLAADRAALAWIEAALPDDTRFLVNARPWQGRLYMGVDGGYWITPVTARVTTAPPVLYGMANREAILNVEALNQDVAALKDAPEALARVLTSHDITHVFLGALGGGLDPAKLDRARSFALIYADDRTRIYEIRD